MARHRADECSQRLAKIPGIGPIGAMLLKMKTPEPELFRFGRQFAAWIGLTPKDHSTAGKVRLGVITRAGDEGLRSVLVVGATTLILMSVFKSEDERLRSLLSSARVLQAAHGRERRREATVDQTLMRGLATAGPGDVYVAHLGPSSVSNGANAGWARGITARVALTGRRARRCAA